MVPKLFIEGIADRKFILDYVSYRYNIALSKEDIIEVGGWTNIYAEGNNAEMIFNEMNKKTDNGGENIIIFDSDASFKERLEEIEAWRIKNKLKFEFFLWPNHLDSGDLEVLLENIINVKNSPIFNCWDNYEACLNKLNIVERAEPLTTPARKTKIYGYLEALLGNSNSQKEKIKERNRNYQDASHWNLDSKYLGNLNYFLDRFFDA